MFGTRRKMNNIRAFPSLLFIISIGCLAEINDNFDVINILRLERNDKGGYEQYGDFYVDIQGDARGLPLLRNTNPPTVDPGYENHCCRNWTRDGWREETPLEGEPAPPLDITKQVNNQTVAAIWRLDNSKGELKSQPKQLPENKLCVTMLLRLPVNGTLTIKIQNTDGTKTARVSTLRGRDLGYEWLLRRFETRTPRDFRKKPSVLILSAEKPENISDSFYVQWAGFCEPSTKEQKIVVSGKFSSSNVTEQVRHVMTTGLATRHQDHAGLCQNGGRLNPYGRVCKCAPGFSGEVCENGCGPNKYGLECTGECSGVKDGRDCAGFKVCDDGGCTCVAGWQGEHCDASCGPGWYGSGCDQKCGSCRGGDTCNRHTGHCDDGCEDEFEPPYCHNVCGRQYSRSSLKDSTVADPKDFPWNVGLYDVNRGAVPQIICSGTLVTRSLAVTAAHCVFNEATSQVEKATRYIVVLGKQRHDLNTTDIYENRIQRRNLRNVHVPPTYRGSSRSYFDDIALLELDGLVDLSDVARPSCFDWTGRFQPNLEEVGTGEVVGWGRDEAGNVVEKMVLARPRYLSLNSCLKTVRPSFLQYLTPDKFCGENTGGQALRRGNSGGGLLFNSFLVGVTSVAHPHDHKTVAYTNVTYHRNWLNKVRSGSELREAMALFTKLSNA